MTSRSTDRRPGDSATVAHIGDHATGLIDERALRSCREDFDAHEIRAIVATLREQSHDLSGQAASGADAPDLGLIADAAHTLRSTCAVVGAIGVAACCREVERAARSGDLAGVRIAIADLPERTERTAAAISRAGGRS